MSWIQVSGNRRKSLVGSHFEMAGYGPSESQSCQCCVVGEVRLRLCPIGQPRRYDLVCGVDLVLL